MGKFSTLAVFCSVALHGCGTSDNLFGPSSPIDGGAAPTGGVSDAAGGGGRAAGSGGSNHSGRDSGGAAAQAGRAGAPIIAGNGGTGGLPNAGGAAGMSQGGSNPGGGAGTGGAAAGSAGGATAGSAGSAAGSAGSTAGSPGSGASGTAGAAETAGGGTAGSAGMVTAGATGTSGAGGSASGGAGTSGAGGTTAGSGGASDVGGGASVATCFDTQASTRRPIVKPSFGSLIINELMADPAMPISGASGEWFELMAVSDVDLNGLRAGSTAQSPVLVVEDGPCVSLSSGSLAVFAHSRDASNNGLPSGLEISGTFNFNLSNGTSKLTISTAGGELLDEVDWTSTSSGRSLARTPGGQFCTVTSAAPYSENNFGTPGAIDQDPCP